MLKMDDGIRNMKKPCCREVKCSIIGFKSRSAQKSVQSESMDVPTDGNAHISGARAISEVCMNVATFAALGRGIDGNSLGGAPSLCCAVCRNRCDKCSS